VNDFVRQHGIEWPQCFSGTAYWDNALARRFGGRSPADFLLIGPDGRLEKAGSGADELARALGGAATAEK
jgi:hypothetical protein